MPIEISAIYAAALALPEDLRLKLADELLASIDPSDILSIDDPDLVAVLTRRQQELCGGTATTYSAEETIAAMRQIVDEQHPR